MRTFIGPDIILSDLTEGPTLFAQSAIYITLSECINVHSECFFFKTKLHFRRRELGLIKQQYYIIK